MNEIREVLSRYLSPYASLDTDRLGSLIARQEGKAAAPNIMIAAHMDEIGFMVKPSLMTGLSNSCPWEVGGIRYFCPRGLW